MIGLVTVVLILAAPALVTLWAGRPRRAPLEVYTMHPAPRTQSIDATPDLRTPEQRAADQRRVDELGFPRG